MDVQIKKINDDTLKLTINNDELLEEKKTVKTKKSKLIKDERELQNKIEKLESQLVCSVEYEAVIR